MFTGELMDANELVYLRARYYHPGLGVFMSLDPVEGVNRYQYVSSNPINRTDASGLLPCDTPGGQDQACLDRIQNRLIGGPTINWSDPTDISSYSLATLSEHLARLAPTSGADVAAEFLQYYFSGGGEDYILNFSRLDPAIINQAGMIAQEAFESVISGIDVCSTCSPCQTQIPVDFIDTASGYRFLKAPDPNQTQNRLGGLKGNLPALSNSADWYPALADTPIIGGKIANVLYHPNIGVDNPFYSAMGTVTVSNVGTSTLNIIPAGGNTYSAEVRIPVQVWDFYDWCFGDAPCLASGTHPWNMRAGHFIALEKAGRAQPFNMYANGYIKLKYFIGCPNPNWNRGKGGFQGIWFEPAEFPQRNFSATPKPIGDIIDNWPTNPGFPLFPTEQELSATGAINWTP